MTELEDLRGRTFHWKALDTNDLELRLYEGNQRVGAIYAPVPHKPAVLAEVAGIALRIAWTGGETSFYRIDSADLGSSVGEARFLPWRRDTFQAKLDGIRAYSLKHESPHVVIWKHGPLDAMSFVRPGSESQVGCVAVKDDCNLVDAPPLLALGVLLADRGVLF